MRPNYSENNKTLDHVNGFMHCRFQLPFFREKPQTIPIVASENVRISCFAVGDPKPVVQWYK